MFRIPKSFHVFWNNVGRWRIVLYLAVFFLLFSSLHFAFLGQWKVSHVKSTIFIKTDSNVSGIFNLNFEPQLNVSPPNFHSNPEVPFSIEKPTIRFLVTDFTKGSVLEVSLDNVQLENREEISLNWPNYYFFKIADCAPPEAFNGTIYLTNCVIATTPLGNVSIYQFSFGTSWKNGKSEYLDDPDWMHNTYRIHDLLDVFFVIVSLIGASITGSRIGIPFCKSRFPYLTLVSYLALFGLYVFIGTGFNVLYSHYGEIWYSLFVVLLSPFFHWDYNHLINNAFGFLPISLAMESSLNWKSLKHKLFFFWVPIFSINYLLMPFWLLSGRPNFGLSYSTIWLVVGYGAIVLNYRKELFKNNASAKFFLCAILMGFSLSGVTYNWVSSYLSSPTEYSLTQAICHNLTFLFAIVPSVLLAKKCKEWEAVKA